ncbi:hypothetical protein AALC25_12090 [Lachnospiraceae bacterium 29-84]
MHFYCIMQEISYYCIKTVKKSTIHERKLDALEDIIEAAEDVADYSGIERASAYRRKNRALAKLTTLLFGKL